MTITIHDSVDAEIVISGPKPSDNRATVSVIPTSTPTGGTDSAEELDDSNWVLTSGAEIEIGAIVQSAFGLGATYKSCDESIASVDGNGVVTRVFQGGPFQTISRNTDIVVNTPRVSERVTVVVGYNNSRGSESFVGWKDNGNLGKALYDIVDQACSSAPSTNSPTQSGQMSIPNEPKNAGHWNPYNWAYRAGIKLWPISIWNSINEGGGWWGGATLIHPKFAVVAHHYTGMWQIGTQFQWRGPDNVNHTRTVIATHRHSNVNADTNIIELDSPLPESIGVAAVFPSGFASYIPAMYSGVNSANGHFEDAEQATNFCIPALVRNRYDFLRVQDWLTGPAVDGAYSTKPTSRTSTPSYRARYMIDGSSGDSSNNLFTVHPVTKALIVFAIDTWMDEINTWMDSRLSGATMTIADLSAYPLFD